MIHLPAHKCELTITHNTHKSGYETVAQWIKRQGTQFDDHHLQWSSETAKDACIATDELWEIQWFPHTPGGSYVVYGPTLKEILDWASHVCIDTEVSMVPWDC